MKKPPNLGQQFRYLPEEPEDRVWGVLLHDAGSAVISPGSHYPPAGHPKAYDFAWKEGRVLNEFQILFISRGRGTLETRRAGVRHLRAGQAFVLFPKEWHRYRPAANTGWTECWVGFSGDYVAHLMQHYFSAEDPVITPEDASEIETMIQQLVTSIAGLHQVGARSLLAVRMLDLVARLYQHRQKPAASAAHPRLESARMDILTHATERIDWIDMARRYGMGYATFRRRFKEMTGHSPLDYQIQVRLNRAAELLRKESTTAREIAERLGYAYVHFFSRQFKKRFGHSPQAYRSLSGQRHG